MLTKEEKNRDKYLLELMIRTYDGENQRNYEVDSKSYNMIAIIGIMFSIEATFLVNILNFSVNIIIKLCFFAILFCYFLSISFFIWSLRFKTFKSLPQQDALADYYKVEKSFESIISTLLGNYQETINYNMEIIDEKIAKSKIGFNFFIIGLIFTISFIILYLVI